jgi:hypothetical protein
MHLPVGRNLDIVPKGDIISGFIEIYRTLRRLAHPVELPCSVQKPDSGTLSPDPGLLISRIGLHFPDGSIRDISRMSRLLIDFEYLRVLPVVHGGRLGIQRPRHRKREYRRNSPGD